MGRAYGADFQQVQQTVGNYMAIAAPTIAAGWCPQRTPLMVEPRRAHCAR